MNKKTISIAGIFLAVALIALGVYFYKDNTNTVENILGGRQAGLAVIMNGVRNVASSTATINTRDAENVICSIDWDAGATPITSTVKFVGSIQATAPTFSAAQSSTNQYEFLDSVNLQSMASVDGDTGYSASSTQEHLLVSVAVNNIDWFSARLVTSTLTPLSGPVTVKCITSNTR